MEAWKERFVHEYKELADRHEKLGIMLDKMGRGELEFVPNCSYDLLHEQYVYMGAYKATLEYRAKVEKIDLD